MCIHYLWHQHRWEKLNVMLVNISIEKMQMTIFLIYLTDHCSIASQTISDAQLYFNTWTTEQIPFHLKIFSRWKYFLTWPQIAEVVEAAALGTPITAPSQAIAIASSYLNTHCSDLDMVLAGLNLGHLANTFAKHQVSVS